VSSRYLAADGLILLACVSSSFYIVFSKELLRRFTPLKVLIYGYLIAAGLSAPLLVWLEPVHFSDVLYYTAAVWLSLMVLSGLSWGLAMVLWMILLKRLDVSGASVSIYLLPFLGVIISTLTLGERITGTMVLGGFVTLAGTILITSMKAHSL
jgi:drug/metabolite transporter (DMT)-like permease